MRAVVEGNGPARGRAHAGSGCTAAGAPGNRFQASSLVNIGSRSKVFGPAGGFRPGRGTC
jgi:hypothetical protein